MKSVMLMSFSTNGLLRTKANQGKSEFLFGVKTTITNATK